ncbi:hypothetical protein CN570_06525 [Bacillus toyonensis]|nr:hypothetical protein CN570_06525 [Bacillus toyonensis]
MVISLHQLGENVSVKLTFFVCHETRMIRCHIIDIIYNCYSNIEICLFIIGELERNFRNNRENLFTRKIFYNEIGRVI